LLSTPSDKVRRDIKMEEEKKDNPTFISRKKIRYVHVNEAHIP